MLQEYNLKKEKILMKKWEGKATKFKTSNSKKKIFSIDTPPPYPSGKPWHIGAAAHYSQIDMIARTARMHGNNVFFPIGIDRNGLPVELYTEKKFNVKMHLTPREKFIELCSHALDDLENEMIQIMKDMGLSGDFKNYYRTDSAEYRALTQATFIELWKRGLIYEATRPNNYCIDCGTTIADAEITYKELPTELVYLKFKIKETKKELIIATTRPELLCSCQIILVNPADSRYKNIIGKHVVVPLYDKEIRITKHPYAKPEFGTGAVMMCSYGDYADVRIFRELGLKEIIAIDSKGKMTKEAGKYENLNIKEARKKIIGDLENSDLIEKKEKILHRTPICERSNTEIEIIPMQEFYLKQLDFLDKLKEFSKTIEFYPKEHKQLWINWINSITMDWPISRRRFYGTEIPIWYCKKCKEVHVPKPGKYYRPWKEKAPLKKCSKCNSSEFIGEERTFDTWMDSSISCLFISKYKKDEKFFKIIFPNTIRPQGKDIIRTWLHYTLLRCFQLTGKCAFKKAWIMGYGVDEKGERMSKSKGNVIDPIPVIEKYGADSFRFWAASESSLGSDFRCSEQRIEAASKFLNKLFNIAKFISNFSDVKKPKELKELDKWIINELNESNKKALQGYKEFNFFVPANELRNFLWNIFASHYLELIKSRAYAKDDSALYTLNYCLKNSLKLLAPIIPLMTDYISHEMYKKTIHSELFPKTEKTDNVEFSTKELEELNSLIWKEKKLKGMSLKAEIKEIEINENFKKIEEDLKKTHNIIKIRYGKKTKIKI